MRHGLQVAIACGSLWSCTFGGSDEDPRTEVELASPDASLDAQVAPTSEEPSAPTLVPPSSPSAAQPDAGKLSPPHVSGFDAGVPAPIDACDPREPVSTCDPVRNTGCPPLTQCDIDTSATTPAGRCVFPQTATGSDCSASFVSETCAPQFTCAANACRKLCYCDADCGVGACCSDPSASGPAGFFKLCQPC